MTLSSKEHLRIATKLTSLLDTRFGIGSFRFGFDAILGLIPGVGDSATMILGLYILWIAHQHRVPTKVVGLMLINLVIDTVLGAVPLLGDLFDIAWKANVRNLDLLKPYLSR